MNRLLFALGFVLLTGSVFADNVNISASERGFVCTNTPQTCSSNGANPGNEYWAGFSNPDTITNWFEFPVPTLTGSLLSATLNLDEPGSFGHSGGTTTFTVYGISGQPSVAHNVTTSDTVFGSASLSSADNGTTVSITLNAAALTAISADQGGNFFIGGIDSGTGNEVFDFFFTSSSNASTLDLTTAGSTVPEPSSLPLLIIVGFAVVLASQRLRTLRG